MNKGFTLIELVGTIVILSLLLLVAVPAVSRSMKKGVSDADEQAKQGVVLAAKNYSQDHKSKTGCKISASKLKELGYLDESISLPSNSSQTLECVLISKDTSKAKVKYSYSYTDCTGTMCE